MDLTTMLGRIKMATPVLPASGTFGYGNELVEIIPYSMLGAIVTKTLTWHPRKGNPPGRITECGDTLINSIGLQNIGVKEFCEEALPKIVPLQKPIIASVGGHDPDGMLKTVEYIDREEITAIELNLSCPNLGTTRLVAQDPEAIKKTVASARSLTQKALIAKLTPHVADIAETGLAAEEAGADILCAGNTFKGIVFDWKKETLLAGGVSGKGIFPLALRTVYDLYQAVTIPIIGMGGISEATDALAMILLGATAIGIGTAMLIDPNLPEKVCQVISEYMKKKSITSINDLVGIKNGKKNYSSSC
jgi:dihydroorotate dehydrogenase (NAD+) catalytic subunit